MKQRHKAAQTAQTFLQSQLCFLCLFTAFEAVAEARIDYSRFLHFNPKHRLECHTCHKFPSPNWKAIRKESDAFPDIAEPPEHKACVGCHRAQFFARERPAPRICLNCHLKATPKDTTRFPFPSLGEPFLASAKGRDFVSEFRVSFPHDKHLESQDKEAEACAACHQSRRQMFKTIPLTHSNCFTCHNQESELAPLPQSCGSCHKPAEGNAVDFDPRLIKSAGFDDPVALFVWRSRSSAGAFSHEPHEDVACTKCHDVKRASEPGGVVPRVHITSCGGAEGCHITATADDGGALNYEMDQRKANAQFACVKCHFAFGGRPAPLSHVNAVAKASSQ